MGDVLRGLLFLLGLDLVFVLICLLALAPLAIYKKAAFAVLRRNFVGYFSNPTGYVFLCLFVLLTSLAAFWPHEFFTANLANLDQLNKVLPIIMLIFIPAITMSIWADEKRLGTDELLLTLPADDFDIVIGKYLAAACIFTSSLLFSQLANYSVLAALTLGDLDTGLFFATYLGYWLVGLAMLSVGMVASFLTSNVTVAFILGVVFNAPLAFGGSADVIVGSDRIARTVSFWGLSYHFDDLGRGVISLSSFAYFFLIVGLGLYICMVMIGARHWSGGKDGGKMFWHYLFRTVALAIALIALTLTFTNHDLVRRDVTAGKVSSLSPKTKELISSLDTKYPITIDAFISAKVPEQYVQTRFNLVSLLKEFDADSSKINVTIHDNLDRFSDDAERAEERYGISPTRVRTKTRGAFKDEDVILGAAFTCGLEKVVVPFFDYGIPVEYELIRSIGTVAQEKRKKVGVVRTAAQMFGGFSFAGGMPRQLPRMEIIDELEKQYDVEDLDPTSPIDVAKYDVLIAVQPSSLSPEEFENFLTAVRSGVPTAIFEDPQPSLGELAGVPGTGEPKQQPGGMGGMFGGGGGGPMPKGDIRKLWELLGIESPGEPSFQGGGFNPDIAWQDWLPYKKLQIQGIPNEWVFASNQAPGAERAVNPDDPITAGLQQILFPLPGTIKRSQNTRLDFEPLVKTSKIAGTIRFEQFRSNQQDPARLRAAEGRPSGDQILVARIQGDAPAAEVEAGEEGAAPASSQTIHVVYVADIDLMTSAFMRIRARPEDDAEIDWKFENVTFMLNIVDSLSGDDSYVEIRRRKPHHSTLKVVEQRARQMQDEEFNERLKFEEKYKTAIAEAEEDNKNVIDKFQSQLDELQKSAREGKEVSLNDLQQAAQALAIEQQRLNQRLDVTREQLQRERDTGIEKAEAKTERDIREIQNGIRFWAIALPPIAPFLVGLVVFVRRRLREREGISRDRLR